MAEYESKKQDQPVRTIRNSSKLGQIEFKDKRTKFQIQQKTLQRFAIPDALESLKTDIEEIKFDMSNRHFASDVSPVGTMSVADAKKKEIVGSKEWAEDSRSAALRKLNEWEALKLAALSGEEPRFGIDDVTEPDVYSTNVFGGRTNVVENKYVGGQRQRITENVKDAITQLLTGNRPKNYYGRLIARVQLADFTKDDLFKNTNSGGITRMQNGWKAFANSLFAKRTIPQTTNFELWIHIGNWPYGSGIYEEKLVEKT